ncbi:preprotein translocase subunit SecY [Candidatus Moduliflexota bacterium]
MPELRRRLFFTFAMLVVYRVGAHIPTPGIDLTALDSFFEAARGTMLGFFDMFSGGALRRLTIFALGIMPYINAAIILELLKVVIPHLARLAKEGDAGRKKLTQYTRYGTIVIAIVQATGISIGLESMSSPDGTPIVPFPGIPFRLLTIITLTSGTAFIMWLGEQITERGIGNGISLIIFAGIVVRMPLAIIKTFTLYRTGEMPLFLVLFLGLMMFAVVGIIVFCETGQRKIPVQYARRVVGRKMYGGQSTYIPLKINTSGVIPPIFASSIIMFPATIAQFINVPFMQAVSNLLQPGRVLYESIFVFLIVFFCYFYTAVVFNPNDLADNLKKYGGFIPGIRPGKKTAEYIDRVLTRITLGGAAYVSAICVLPDILISRLNVPFYFGGTALLIAVVVAKDTVTQIESHLLTRHYKGFLKK